MRELANVNAGAHVDVRADGKVLIAQPDVCRNYNYYYDLYTWSAADGMQRKTQCGRYRNAVWLGEQIAALRMEGGVSTLGILEQHGKRLARIAHAVPRRRIKSRQSIWLPVRTANIVALAIKQASAWQVLEFDSTGGSPRVLFNYDAPLHGLRYARTGDGLEFIAVKDGMDNLWRYSPGSAELTRLSHTYTAVISHSGIAQDGSVVLGVLAEGGTELRRMQTTAPLGQAKLAAASSTALPGDTPPITSKLGESGDYHALYSMYPRTWLPATLADRGLTAYGAYTWGNDALGWHNYTANVMWETSQHEAIGNFSYDYLDEHFFNVSRNLWARQWTGSGKQRDHHDVRPRHRCAMGLHAALAANRTPSVSRHRRRTADHRTRADRRTHHQDTR